jgi:hypothetical protein
LKVEAHFEQGIRLAVVGASQWLGIPQSLNTSPLPSFQPRPFPLHAPALTRNMSFGYSVGDFIAVTALAYKVYKSCSGASESFRNISAEVRSMQLVLEETQDLISENKQSLEPRRVARLVEIKDGCHDVLRDLERLLEKYESLGSDKQRTRDKVKWGLEEVSEVRERLSINVNLLTSFNMALAKCASSFLIT